MNLLDTAPGTKIAISEQSILPGGSGSFAIGVQGPTLRGIPSKAVFIANTNEMREVFGGAHPEDDFTIKCERMLNAGVKLYVSRVVHYTDITDPLTIEGTKATATLTESANTVEVTAKAVGAGYNGTTVSIQDAGSEESGKVDIFVLTSDGYSEQVLNQPETPTTEQLTEINDKLSFVTFGTLTGNLPKVGVSLTGGAETIGDIESADYVGDQVAKTGWYSFSGADDMFRMANIHRADPEVDAGLSSYATTRYTNGQPVRFHLATPASAVADGQIAYRKGTVPYSHSPIFNWLGSIVGGGVKITDPRDNTKTLVIPNLVEALIRIFLKDNGVGTWFSAAGYDRGRIATSNKGLVYNVGTVDEKDNFDAVHKSGINSVIERDGTAYYFGNATLNQNRYALLAKENISDLNVYIMRQFKPILESVNFEPNDPDTWKLLYRRALLFINQLEDGRAIFPGEGRNWFWLGDQDAQDVQEVSYNKLSDINQGIYKTRFIYTPIAAIEKVVLDATITDSASLSFIVSQ